MPGWRTFGQRPLLPNIQTSSGGLLMSALCQKQTHAVQQLGLLLDHLVGASEDCRRHCETNRPSRREIDRQLELARLLNRNWPAAAEDRRGGARFFYDGRDGQGFRLSRQGSRSSARDTTACSRVLNGHALWLSPRSEVFTINSCEV